MNIALDLIIVAIIAFNIVYAVKKGFVKIVLRSLTVVVSLILAFMLMAPVRSALSATEYSTKAEAAIRDGPGMPPPLQNLPLPSPDTPDTGCSHVRRNRHHRRYFVFPSARQYLPGIRLNHILLTSDLLRK